ncbi:hypothetical protein BIY37_04540, partial [Candidatus Brocadia sapporoensis]
YLYAQGDIKEPTRLHDDPKIRTSEKIFHSLRSMTITITVTEIKFLNGAVWILPVLYDKKL